MILLLCQTLSDNFHTLQVSLKVFAILVNLVQVRQWGLTLVVITYPVIHVAMQSFSKRAVLSYALKVCVCTHVTPSMGV